MASNEFVQTVADTIIDQLKEGTAPWIKPWRPGERHLPYNPTTGKDYRGANTLWLMAVGQARGYGDPRWMTYNQAQDTGAQVRKGETGTGVQYWKWQGLEPVLGQDGKPVTGEDGQPLKQIVRYERPRVLSAVVFNAAQIDGLPEAEARPVLPEWQRHKQAERLLSAGDPKILHEGGNRAFYSPVWDHIVLPERSQFPSADGFYATALHEKGHWTGHSSRLDRDLSHPFGSAGYAKEELRAEIASMVLGQQLEIGHDPGQHVAYIGSWIEALQEDPREIFRAAADAEKIVKHLNGLGQQLSQEQGQQQGRDHTSVPAQGQDEGGQVKMPVLITETQALAMQTVDERVYLAVPYAEKDEAKGLGARWDREQKTWYAPPGVDLAPLEKWRPGHTDLHVDGGRDPRAEFAAALREAGLHLDGPPEMDGQMRRVRVEGDKPGERSGAYVGHMDGHPAGYIKNHKTGVERNWKAPSRTQAATTVDRARLTAEAAQRRQARAQERELVQERAADAAEVRLAQAEPATDDHPYLLSKDVPSYGLRQDREGNLLVPIQGMDGKVISVQAITAEGRKSFQKDARTQGGHFLIGDAAASKSVLVAEGYATAATLHRETGLAVAVAFNAGNLRSVAEALRQRYPDKPLVIAGDNDHVKERQGKPNVGREKAEDAAARVGGTVLLPTFRPDDRGTDWNDLARAQGQAVLFEQVSAGLARGERQRMAAELAQARKPQTQGQERSQRQDEGRRLTQGEQEIQHRKAQGIRR
ncbi:zincin-like metallopeptidase domain-containing protein [Azospirillum sp. A1-3]|uniref:zincin-like metallopeptidase domain-containing protein n=1 Tax=Azospirillum sp. A1-3 TaxID=185874 RepID=UPI0020778B74|nr:zincin-like metallopeptidase domain-containing protein [Azospirillum sp. A1-3]MCM8735509.1 zincin-like metallopeptidase domain-containing protein [Azospirillum sp. A1-3]